MKRKLPIGIQTFREIREDNCYYVDKTPYIRRLLDESKHYFLSRPRRFGKSLFLDTLKELFEGNEPLFRGLAIHDGWDWSVRHPVIRLSFGSGHFQAPDGLHAEAMAQLEAFEDAAQVERRYDTAAARFRHLIRALHQQTGQRVALLVDEYDKPILDALETPEVARANRDYLRGLYAAIKDSDAHLRFTFLTGVSKFSKVSIFSGLNNLYDITLDPHYSTICGYTEADLDEVFTPELPGLDRERIREWYNGYNWRGKMSGSTTHSTSLLLFRNREFGPWWFETGTPAFLIETLTRRGIGSVDLDGMQGTNTLLSAFDVDDMEPEALLFQTGYLTIRSEEDMDGEPAVPAGLSEPRGAAKPEPRTCCASWTPAASRRQLATGLRLRELLAANDFAGIEALFRAFFASIPYEWHTKNEIARYEGYYASVLYSHFAAAGLDVVVEDSSSLGRVDMAVRFNSHVYLFEFKLAPGTDREGLETGPTGAAMAQLKAKGYADKYRHLGQPIHLVGVAFSRETRNLTAFVVETV